MFVFFFFKNVNEPNKIEKFNNKYFIKIESFDIV